MERFIDLNTQKLTESKYLCPLSGKKFKGPEFVKKHIFNKHMDKVDAVRKEVSRGGDRNGFDLCTLPPSFPPSLHVCNSRLSSSTTTCVTLPGPCPWRPASRAPSCPPTPRPPVPTTPPHWGWCRRWVGARQPVLPGGRRHRWRTYLAEVSV